VVSSKSRRESADFVCEVAWHVIILVLVCMRGWCGLASMDYVSCAEGFEDWMARPQLPFWGQLTQL
jgi:hypothetical protein